MSQGSHKNKLLAISRAQCEIPDTFQPSFVLIAFSEREASCHRASCTVTSLTSQLPEDCCASHTSVADGTWLFLPLELASSYSIYSSTSMLSVQFIISFRKQFKRFIFSTWPSAPYLSPFILLYCYFYFKVEPELNFLPLKIFYLHSF